MNKERDLNAKLPLKVKFGYGTSGFCSFMAWTAFSYYGLYFMNEVVGMSAAFAGALISLGTLWDAITDPIVGSISDNLKNPKGRRRPLIKFIALPFFIISCLLFTNFGLGETASKIYFVVVILAYYTAQTVLDISASSLGSEMTNNYNERGALATWKNYFGLLSTVAISACLILVDFWGSKFSNPDLGWTATMACYMGGVLIFIIILYKTTEGYERPRRDNEAATKFTYKAVVNLFKNKGTRIVMLIFGISIFANTINYSAQVYYHTEYMGMTADQVALATFVFGFASIVCAYLVDVLMVKIDKKMSWVVAMGLEALVLILAIGFFIMAGSGSMTALVVT
ncbi:MAG: MFS transporter, partial [Eubacterium sp.]|nr:MFS transporter [Candidatus Colimonas fimequi]